MFITHLALLFAEFHEADLLRPNGSIVCGIMYGILRMLLFEVVKHTRDIELWGQVKSIRCLLSSIVADAWPQ